MSVRIRHETRDLRAFCDADRCWASYPVIGSDIPRGWWWRSGTGRDYCPKHAPQEAS